MTKNGFSLIELLIALAILGILIGIAYPSYRSYQQRANRHNIKLVLMYASNELENFHAIGNTYKGATLTDLGISTDEDSYSLQLSELAQDSFLLSAKPSDTQKTATCGTLSINAQGEKKPASCW